MKCIHLFNGIGGFALAAQWMEWENVASCEIDPFCNKVTGYYWPNMKQHGDIKQTDFTIYRGTIDVLTGGFPCQPFSMAGQRKGTDDERHLWPEMFRAIREIQPRYIVGENVPGFLNWNDGVVFEQSCADLESEGYEVQPIVLPACAVNAPHRRDRVWIIANRSGKGSPRQPIGTQSKQAVISCNGSDGPTTDTDNAPAEHAVPTGRDMLTGEDKWPTANPTSKQDKRRGQGRLFAEFAGDDAERVTTDTSSAGREKHNVATEPDGQGHSTGLGAIEIPNWDNFPTQSPVRFRNYGISTGLDGITFPKWRAESIKAAGNAIVPQIAHQIFKAIAATL